MKVQFPSYTNEKLDLHYDTNTQSMIPSYIEIEVKEDKYFKSIEELKEYLEQWNYLGNIEKQNIIKECIDTSIENKKIPKFLTENDNTYSHIVMTYKSLPFSEQAKYKNDYDNLLSLRKSNLSKSFNFIKENKDAIFNMLDEMLSQKYETLKEQWRKASKKRYEKLKALKPKVVKERNVLSAEEKKERRKLANKKYYEKLKEQDKTNSHINNEKENSSENP